jgi:hypothetical protein
MTTPRIAIWGCAALLALLSSSTVLAAGSVTAMGYYSLAGANTCSVPVNVTAGTTDAVNYNDVAECAATKGFGMWFSFPPDNPSTLTPIIDARGGDTGGNICVTVECGCCGDQSTARECDNPTLSSPGNAQALVDQSSSSTTKTKQYQLSAVTCTSSGANRPCAMRFFRKTTGAGCTADTGPTTWKLRNAGFIW